MILEEDPKIRKAVDGPNNNQRNAAGQNNA